MGLLVLTVGLAPACGGHSPSEPAPQGDSLSVLSLSPPQGTTFVPGGPFNVQVLLQYHLAAGPVGELLFDELRADGSPLEPLLPILDFPFPLTQTDGTVPFTANGTVPQGDIGPEILLRFRLFPKGSAVSTTSVTLHYAISP